jgi:pimeloyl-ACP methyl ester carboxylesterase
MNLRPWLLLTLLWSAASLAAPPGSEVVSFESHGAKLAGTIVWPAGEIRAAVVFVHGSGKQTRSLHWGERFARDGIAALVYDKRGVGQSGGEYEDRLNVGEKNLLLLADDAAAAVKTLSTHSRLQGKPIGLAGISQAGWIAPLAAKRSSLVRFLVMWSGPVCKVSEEDIYSKYTVTEDGATAPPYAEAVRARKTPYRWPDWLGRDTDSSEDLAGLSIPGLWIFSDNDRSIPVDLSIDRLKVLRLTGKRFDYVTFSGLGHNNMDGTFFVATEWIRAKAPGAPRPAP